MEQLQGRGLAERSEMVRNMRGRIPLTRLAESIEETLSKGEQISPLDYADLDMHEIAQRKIEGAIAALYIEWLKIEEMKAGRAIYTSDYCDRGG